MSIDSTLASPETQPQQPTPAEATDVEELLVEEVSIDGMCGVY
jgi:mycofactocin precursor